MVRGYGPEHVLEYFAQQGATDHPGQDVACTTPGYVPAICEGPRRVQGKESGAVDEAKIAFGIVSSAISTAPSMMRVIHLLLGDERTG